MRRLSFVTLLLLTAALAVGCSQKSTPTSPAPAPTPPVNPDSTVPPPPTQPPVEPGPRYMTIAQLLSYQGSLDKVILTGNVVAQASDDDDEYLLADGTGEVRLERDEKDLPVGANIRLLGDPQSAGCNVFDGREVCTIEVEVLEWERIQ